MRDPSLWSEECKEKQTDVLLRARLELTEEDFEKIVKASLLVHQICADGLSRRGTSVPGSDPKLPN